MIHRNDRLASSTDTCGANLGTWTMKPDECRQLALLYREVAEEKSGDERARLLLIAANLEEMAEEEDGGDSRDFRTLH